MFLKLLKNDLKAIYKYWWFGALASLVCAMIGSFSYYMLESSVDYNRMLTGAFTLGMFIAFGGITVFVAFTEVLVFIRYYKNFFTDEGYLTFTLPVKRGQLLFSKLLSALIVNATTAILVFIEVFLITISEYLDPYFNYEYYKDIFIQEDGLSAFEEIIYSIEVFMIVVALVIFSIILLYACITFAAMIVNKGKLFAAIGIYYAVSSVLTTFFQIVYFFGGIWFFSWIADLTLPYVESLIALTLLVVILFVCILSILLYTFTLWMLDKKLNLS